MPQSPDMGSALLQKQLFIPPELEDCWEGKEMPAAGWTISLESQNYFK